jgi:hypothetical protein
MYVTKINRPMKTMVVRPANLYGSWDNIDSYTNVLLEYDKTKPTMITLRLIVDNLLGFMDKTSIKDDLSKTVEWYRQDFWETGYVREPSKGHRA